MLQYLERLFSGTSGGGYDYDHYTDAVEDIKQLKRDRDHEAAEDLLMWCIKQTESERDEVASWYYRHLGIVYRKDNRYDDEVNILERYTDAAKNPDADMLVRLGRACELASQE